MATTAPLVSILVPCYNAEPWIAQTLESALQQTYSDCEIIVVDDGSTDNSGSVIESFRHHGIKIIRQKNAGQSAAFNRAIAEARGQYFEFLDADDILAPGKIAAQVAFANARAGQCMISGAWGRFHTDLATVDARPDSLWTPFLDPVEWLVRAWTNQQMMHGAAWLVPASLVRSAGGWNEALSLINDFEFFSRLMLRSDGVIFCPSAMTYYRSGLPGSLSGSRSDRAWESAFQAISLGTAALLQREDSPRTRRACARAFQAFYFDAFPSVRGMRRRARKRIAELGERVGSGPGGPRFQMAARLLGWHAARRLQLLVASLLRRRFE